MPVYDRYLLAASGSNKYKLTNLILACPSLIVRASSRIILGVHHVY